MRLSVIFALAILVTIPAGQSAFARERSVSQERPTDQELSSLISTKLANDKSVTTDAVRVTVKGGVVTLRGMVGKDADRAKIEQLARVPGVVRINNRLTSREKATAKAKDTVSKTGEAITDGWISTRIKTKFMGDESLRASDIKVSTDNHVVTLSGAVPNAAAHAKALSFAKEVEGVNRVVDNLKVASKNH